MGRGFGKGSFGGLGDMGKLMKDMKNMQANMMAAQEELQHQEIVGTSGGGAVKVVVNGKGKILSITIKPEAVDPDDVEMLQDLIVTALKEAEETAEETERVRMEGLTGGVQLPPGLF
ncbi:MAG: YbaB/EbfC family nucleoid-associated protein [Chthonomonadales bacterium]